MIIHQDFNSLRASNVLRSLTVPIPLITFSTRFASRLYLVKKLLKILFEGSECVVTTSTFSLTTQLHKEPEEFSPFLVYMVKWMWITICSALTPNFENKSYRFVPNKHFITVKPKVSYEKDSSTLKYLRKGRYFTKDSFKLAYNKATFAILLLLLPNV